MAKKDYSRRQFVKITASAAISSVIFPGCATNRLNKRVTASVESEAYDYIVVGAGAGGGPVVARLVEAGFRVLLIEAGGRESKPVTDIPVFHGSSTEAPEYSWEFFVQHYENRYNQLKNSKYDRSNNGIFYPRATGLGGCTIHNAMIFMYPDNSDWEHVVNITGDKSWNPKSMREYYKRTLYNYKPLTTRRRTRRNFYKSYESKYKGWLHTEQTSPSLLLRDKKFIKLFYSALKEEGIVNETFEILGFTKTLKLNPNLWSYVQNKLDGVFNVPKTTHNGKRHSTRDLILNIEKKYPHLLTIKTNTLANKLIFNDNKKAVGVEVLEGESLYKASPLFNKSTVKKKKIYKCHKEIILAGGAYNTPQLLMLSGIGDREHLNEFGIETIVNRVGVGKNLQDRYEVTVLTEMHNEFKILKNCTFGEPQDPCMDDYIKNPSKSVYGTNGVLGGIIKKSSKVKKDPDLFIFGLPGHFKGYYKGWSKEALQPNYFSWSILKGHTENAGGEVKLKSNNPQDTPYINFKYFKEGTGNYKNDIDAVLEGVKTVRRMNKVMRRNSKQEIFPGEMIKSDNDIRNWIENEAWGHHASCTSKMGVKEDPMTVIDSKFKVHGVKGLRVVDASSFDKIPGLFLVCPIFMIAEKAAEDIIKDSVNF